MDIKYIMFKRVCLCNIFLFYECLQYIFRIVFIKNYQNLLKFIDLI